MKNAKSIIRVKRIKHDTPNLYDIEFMTRDEFLQRTERKAYRGDMLTEAPYKWSTFWRFPLEYPFKRKVNAIGLYKLVKEIVAIIARK